MLHRSSLSDTIPVVLRAYGYSYQSPTPHDFRFTALSGDGNRWLTQFLVYEDEKLVRLRVRLTEEPYLAHRQPWVMELAGRLDEEIGVCGSFEVSWDRGSVAYRTFRRFYADEQFHTRIPNMLDTLSFPLQVWVRAFRFIERAKVSPAAAVSAALVEVDCHEHPNLSKEARRALLTLEK